MNKKILLLVLSFHGHSIAETFDFNKLDKDPSFDAIFILTDSMNNQSYAKLDCQSYFQKFDFYNDQNQLVTENYITYNECEYLYKNFTSCLEKQNVKCVDDEDIFNQDCKCK